MRFLGDIEDREIRRAFRSRMEIRVTQSLLMTWGRY